MPADGSEIHAPSPTPTPADDAGAWSQPDEALPSSLPENGPPPPLAPPSLSPPEADAPLMPQEKASDLAAVCSEMTCHQCIIDDRCGWCPYESKCTSAAAADDVATCGQSNKCDGVISLDAPAAAQQPSGTSDQAAEESESSLLHMYVLAALVVGVVVGYLRLKKQQRHSAPVGGISSSVASTKYNKVPTAAPEEAAAGWDDGWDDDNENGDGWEDQSGGRYAPCGALVAALGSHLHAAVAPRCSCVQKLERKPVVSVLVCRRSSFSYGNRAGSDDGAGTGWRDEEQGGSISNAPAPAPAPRRKPKKPIVVESDSEGEGGEGDGWGDF